MSSNEWNGTVGGIQSVLVLQMHNSTFRAIYTQIDGSWFVVIISKYCHSIHCASKILTFLTKRIAHSIGMLSN